MKYPISHQYKHFILFLEVILVIVVLGMAYIYMPLNDGSKTFYIASSDENEIIDTLHKNGYEVTWIDKKFLTSKQLPAPGWYTVNPGQHSRLSFFRHLYLKKTTHVMDVVIYAGETKTKLTKRLANDMKLDPEKLLNSYHVLARLEEGEILAGRYTIARKADENTTISYLFDRSRKQLKRFEKTYFKTAPGKMQRRILFTIASIIQKESNSVEEMPLISSVIYNRLKKNMKLQMDGTLNYGPYAHTVVTPERIKNDESRYNTYKYKGLPPHPLSSVSMEALQASVRPAESDYLFFMLNKNGTHDFSATYAQHLENLKAFRKHQKEKKRQKALLAKSAKEKEDINSSKKKPFGLKLNNLSFKKSR